MGVAANAPHYQLTYRIIGLAMEVHNELGPGHREADYHDALCIKFKNAGLSFLDEPEILITLDNGEVVKTRRPDFVEVGEAGRVRGGHTSAADAVP